MAWIPIRLETPRSTMDQALVLAIPGIRRSSLTMMKQWRARRSLVSPVPPIAGYGKSLRAISDKRANDHTANFLPLFVRRPTDADLPILPSELRHQLVSLHGGAANRMLRKVCFERNKPGSSERPFEP